MPSWSGLQKFFGKTVSDAASYAAGQATSATLTPYLQEVVNTAWAEHAILPVDPDAAADVAADDPTQKGWAENEGNKSGLSDANMDRLITAAMSGPSEGQLMDAWRRGTITDAEFTHGLRKMKLEPEYDAAIKDLKTVRLDPSVIANAIVRGVMPAPFALPGTVDKTPGKVAQYPAVDIDTEQEAAASGYDIPRLEVLTAQSGRPMAHQEAAAATFKGIIDRSDYSRAIAEGDTRIEYGDAMFENAREIPSVTNFVEAYVRNWISQTEMFAGAAKHGMTQQDANLMFLIHGRPLTHHQVFIGTLRGGVYDGPTDAIDPHFLKSLQESDMRPEWYNLAWANRYNYPPFFQTASALAKGWIDSATATEWMTKQGYEPTAIAAIVQGITGGAATGATKQLTAAQVKTAYKDGQLGEADALTRLQKDGYSAQDAKIYLGIAVNA